MQRRRHAPEKHARRHPGDHAILAAQRRAHGLQRDEEGEEEGHGRVEVAFLEADVRGEVGRLGVSYLSRLCQRERRPGSMRLTLALSRALKRKRSARNGSNRQSSFRSVRLCRRGSTVYASSGSSASFGGMVRRAGREGAVSSNICTPAMVAVAKRVQLGLHHRTDCR
jgi:hypothetical protein